MDETRLAQSLQGLLNDELAKGLASSFVRIRQDYATRTLERALPGKFVEVFVQSLQFIESGIYDEKPNVDDYLSKRVENASGLPEGLRICGSRAARAMYALRSKRNIAHNNAIDPNSYDLAFVHQGAAWIMAELVRNAYGVSMEEAGALIDLIQAPVGSLVEEIDGTRLVHADVSVKSEILILLHSHYPEYVPVTNIHSSVRSGGKSTVSARISDMKSEKLIFGDKDKGYKLTQPGHRVATEVITNLEAVA